MMRWVVLVFWMVAVASLAVRGEARFDSGNPGAYDAQTLIDFGQSWKVSLTKPETGWEQPGFDDREWEEAAGFVGLVKRDSDLDRHGDQGIGYTLPKTRSTIYMRTNFSVGESLDGIDMLILDMLVKDGAVFYVNGIEVGRTPSMAAGESGYEARAMAAPRLRRKSGFHMDPAVLRAGENVFALSLHSYEGEENNHDRIAAVELTAVKKREALPPSAVPRHVRVVWRENPQNEAVISWTTDRLASKSVLKMAIRPFGKGGEGDVREYAPGHSGAFTLSRDDIRAGVQAAHFYHVYLDDLVADTVYYFVVETEDGASQEYHFRTAPDRDVDFDIIFGGDSRLRGYELYQHEDRRNMNRRIAALTETYAQVLAFIHGGDFCMLAQWRYLNGWLTDHELTYTQDGRILPLVVVRGNHDRDVGFEETFWWPVSRNEYFFHTQFTPSVSLVVLNTEISLGGRQRQWLREQLREGRPLSRWMLAAYHRPAYPSARSVSGAANIRRFWVSLFDEYRVDLALESHDHTMKRTVPILHDEPNPEGVVYIGDGGLGVPQREPDTARWFLQDGGFAASAHHVHLLRFSEDALRGIGYGMAGEVLDEFTRLPRDLQVVAPVVDEQSAEGRSNEAVLVD